MQSNSNKGENVIESALFFFNMFSQFDTDVHNEYIKYIVINGKKYERKKNLSLIHVEWAILLNELKSENGYIGKEDCVFRKVNPEARTVEYYLRIRS